MSISPEPGQAPYLQPNVQKYSHIHTKSLSASTTRKRCHRLVLQQYYCKHTTCTKAVTATTTAAASTAAGAAVSDTTATVAAATARTCAALDLAVANLQFAVRGSIANAVYNVHTASA
eukprot:11475-Heterococcus_DN1.PRE.4